MTIPHGQTWLMLAVLCGFGLIAAVLRLLPSHHDRSIRKRRHWE